MKMALACGSYITLRSSIEDIN